MINDTVLEKNPVSSVNGKITVSTFVAAPIIETNLQQKNVKLW